MTTGSIKIMQLSTYALHNLLFRFVATFDSGLLKAVLNVLDMLIGTGTCTVVV